MVVFIALVFLLVFEFKNAKKAGIFSDPESWLLGKVESGQKLETQIRVKNTSYAGYKITKAETSHGCITAKIIQPHSNNNSDGIIDVKIEVKRDLGTHFNAIIYIYLQKEESEEGSVTITFSIKGSIKGTEYDLKETEIVIFHKSPASDYETVREKLAQIKRKFPQFIIRDYLLGNSNSYLLLEKYEKEYSVINRADIEMFNGASCFAGKKSILNEIDKLLALAELPSDSDENALEVLFFYSSVCGDCDYIREKVVPALQRKYGNQISVKQLDIYNRENYEHLLALEKECNIKETNTITVFAGAEYLQGKAGIEKNLNFIIDNALRKPPASERPANHATREPFLLRDRFKSFGIITVLTAGLLDGINPCVFATIIFFIAFLTFAGRTRKEILAIGIVYIITVFLTYLFLGIGFFKAIQALNAHKTISAVLRHVTTAVVFMLAAITLYDIIGYVRTRRTQKTILQLPLSIKQRIHTIIRRNIKTRGLVIGAVITGFLVTLFETICSGQVYFPIIYMLNDPLMKINAYSYLLLYNFMFIIPLTAIFLIAYFSVSLEEFSKITSRNLILVKILMFLFFAGLGAFLLMNRLMP